MLVNFYNLSRTRICNILVICKVFDPLVRMEKDIKCLCIRVLMEYLYQSIQRHPLSTNYDGYLRVFFSLLLFIPRQGEEQKEAYSRPQRRVSSRQVCCFIIFNCIAERFPFLFCSEFFCLKVLSNGAGGGWRVVSIDPFL